MSERWIVTLSVTREADEPPPSQWDWEAYISDVDPILIQASYLGDDDEQ